MNSEPARQRFDGLTVTERLREDGLLESFEAALRLSDRTRIIRLLRQVDLTDQAADIATQLLSGSQRIAA